MLSSAATTPLASLLVQTTDAESSDPKYILKNRHLENAVTQPRKVEDEKGQNKSRRSTLGDGSDKQNKQTSIKALEFPSFDSIGDEGEGQRR